MARGANDKTVAICLLTLSRREAAEINLLYTLDDSRKVGCAAQLVQQAQQKFRRLTIASPTCTIFLSNVRFWLLSDFQGDIGIYRTYLPEKEGDKSGRKSTGTITFTWQDTIDREAHNRHLLRVHRAQTRLFTLPPVQ